MTWNEADHPRVPKGNTDGGQFTDKAGSVGEAAREAAGVTTGLTAVLKEKGGFSESLDGENPPGGYMVGIEGRVYDREITDRDILDFVLEHFALLNKEDHYVGGWLDPDTGEVWLDVSRNYLDRAEAIRAGHEYEQISIYDIENDDLIYMEKEAVDG
jgi:hypothetical protein